MSVNAILTGQQKSYTKAEEDAFLAARANKKDFVYIESSSTATNAYRVGEYFYWTDGSIYRAQKNIASGATLVASGNCNRVGGNGALNSAQNSKVEKSDLAIINGTGSIATNSYKAGEYFYWRNSLYQAITDISLGATLSIGTNCIATQALNCQSGLWTPNTNLVTLGTPARTCYIQYGNLLIIYFNVILNNELTDHHATSFELCTNVKTSFKIPDGHDFITPFVVAPCLATFTSNQAGKEDIILRVVFNSSSTIPNGNITITNRTGTSVPAGWTVSGNLTLGIY